MPLPIPHKLSGSLLGGHFQNVRRLTQKTDNRLPVELELTFFKYATLARILEQDGG